MVCNKLIQKAKPYFSKKVRTCCSMGCMMRTYFRGNWQSQGGVRSTTKNAPCAKPRQMFEITENLRYTQTKSQKTDEYFQNNHIFWRRFFSLTKIRCATLATKIYKNQRSRITTIIVNLIVNKCQFKDYIVSEYE